MKIDDKGRILSFSEKPKGEDLKAMVTFKISFTRNFKWVEELKMIVLMNLNFIISIHIEGGRYNHFGTVKRRGSEEAIYCFHGSVRL